MESNEAMDLARLVEQFDDLNVDLMADDAPLVIGLWAGIKVGIRAQQERIERLEAVARAADAYLYSYEGTDELEAALRVWKGEGA